MPRPTSSSASEPAAIRRQFTIADETGVRSAVVRAIPRGTRTPSSTRCTSAPSTTANGDGIGDFPGLTERLDYLAGARRRLPLAAALLPVAAARRRLRHRRLLHHPPRLRHARRLPGVPRRGAPARHPGHHRAGDEPHLRPAPVVPGGAARTADSPEARLLRLERHRRPGTPTRASSSPTPRRRTGRGTRWRSSTTGTASSPTSPTSTTTTPRSQETMLDVMRFWLDIGRRRLPPRRRALPLRARGHQLREPAGDARRT